MTSWYMVAEMLPTEELEKSPSREFSRGMGFESPHCEFLVYGPVLDWEDFEPDQERLEHEGYITELVRAPAPMV
jgi:hypothetical protein